MRYPTLSDISPAEAFKIWAASETSGQSGGLEQFTKACALYYAPLGIRVNAVALGHTRTPMGNCFVNLQKGPRQYEIDHINKNHPLGRQGEPEEVAAAIYFLLSGQASFITGAILSVDGGYVTKY